MKVSVLPVLAALPILAVFAAGAQQLKPPGNAAQNPSGMLAQPVNTQNGAVSSDPAQRSQAPKITSKGPATDADRPVQPASTAPAAPAKPSRVTDTQGRLVNGAVPMGPNQVMDPKTGKVYTTMPQGDGQRIIEPRPKP